MRIAVAFLLVCAQAFGWHPVGHKIIAAICYDELSAKTRAKVDALLRAHPDYAALSANASGNKGRRAFINLAGWPDDIKGDPRFYSDTARNPVATPTLPGFPDMKRHTDWHYVNFYFSPDNTPFPATPPTPNVLTQMPVVIDGLKGPFAPYYLGWFEHLVGDIHEPMHNISRFVAWNKGRNGRPQSDLGGNSVNVDGFTNLHAVWDDLLGTVDDPDYIDWMARRLRREFPAEKTPDLDPEHWSHAGFELAKSEAYKFGAEFGSNDKPFRRTPEYTRNALPVARRQGALGGRRMAAILTARLD